MASLKEIDFDPFAGSPTAPAGGVAGKAATPGEFAKVYGGAAKTAGDALGVDPNVIIGQWGLETGWGKSIIPGTNNLGNIKDMTSAGVGATDNMTGSKDKYRAYATPDDFAKDYVSLIQRKYPGAQNAGNDPGKFTAGLKGYAEDPRYPEKVAQASRMTRTPENPIVRGLNAVAGAVLPSAQAAQLKEVDFDPFAQTAPGAAPVASAPPKRSMIEDLGRQLGLTVRAGVNGVAAIPAMAADAVTGPINLGLDAVAGKGDGFRFKQSARSLDDAMTAAGLPKPENAQERVVQDAASAVAGAGGIIKGGLGLANYAKGPVTQAVGKMLAAGPTLQLASAAAGAGASGATREAGGGAGAQMAAGLAGALTPGLAPAAGNASLRYALRGGEAGRQIAATNLATFEAAGTRPSLAQATGGRVAQATESMLSKTAGGAGVMAKFAAKQADDMATSVQKLSDELAPGANATNAGEAIERGLTAFKEGTKQIQQRLYADLDRHIPAGTPITSDRTQAALADLNTDIAGAPELSRWFKNARIQGVEAGLKSDTTSLEAVLSRPGMKQQVAQMQSQLEAEAAKATAVNAERRMLGMNNMEPVTTPAQIKEQIDGFLTKQVDNRLPYESVKKLRTLVGRELADSTFTSDVPRSKWSALYGALSDDLGLAAKNAGPEAEKSWSWANQFTRTQMERLDQLKGVMSKGTPEKIFNDATSGTVEGATTITRVISALPKQERREVVAAVLQRMGRATPGQQNAMGEAFSSETFLTNLSKISPEARQTLFGRTDVKGIQGRVEDLAKIAEIRRDGNRVFANSSGTAQASDQISTAKLGFASLGSAVTGSTLPLVGVLAAPLAAKMAAKVLTNPATVRVATTKTPIIEGTQASILGAATRINSTGQAAADAPEAQLQEVDFDPFAQGAAGPAPAGAAQPEPGEPARIELGGMAQQPGLAPAEVEPAPELPQEEADPAEAQQSFVSEPRADGTLAIRGDPQALHATLVASGIPARSIVRNAAGVMVGRSQAGRVQEAIARMRQPSPEDVATGAVPADEMVAENQPPPATPENAQSAPVYAQNEQSVLQNQAPDAQTDELYAQAPELAGQPIDSNRAAFASEPGAESVAQAESTPAPIDVAAHAAATSPHNERPEPSVAQQKAGNYALGHDRIAGMDVSIENPQGSVRRGVDPDGKPWETQMQHHYGYFKRTTANDGDKLDVFIKPGTPRDFAGPVFVIDQTDPGTGKLDEHKVVMGAASEDEAKAIYRSNYSDDWQGMGSITRLPLPAFRAWAASGDKKHALGDLQAQRSEGPAMPPEAGATEQMAAADEAAAARISMAGRIQRLHDAGEDQVAKMLQRNHDSEQTLSAVQTELASLRESAPDLPHHQNPHFEGVYQQQRVAGAKPAEAAARAGILAAVQQAAPGTGMPEKAVAALQAKLDKMPVDDAPSFVQRFTQSLIAKGFMPAFQGADQIEQMLVRARDGSMNAMVDSAYREIAG